MNRLTFALACFLAMERIWFHHGPKSWTFVAGMAYVILWLAGLSAATGALIEFVLVVRGPKP